MARSVYSCAKTLKNSHADHLNTPRLVADATGTTVWRWDQQEPFGNNVPDENPSGLGAFDLPLRLPGQRYDAETGLHYNYFRDYDPSLGRYGESDPIGLRGGLNSYAYVRGSPLRFSDLLGLDVLTDKLVEELVRQIGGSVSISVIEQLLAEACIARNCRRGGTARTYIQAWGDCSSEMDSVDKKVPGIAAAIAAKTQSSEGAIGGCAAKCQRETNVPGFRLRCSPACAPTSGADGAPT